MTQVYRIFAASNVKKAGSKPPFLTTYLSQRRPPGRRGASGGFANFFGKEKIDLLVLMY
jgi:hypothetical protein